MTFLGMRDKNLSNDTLFSILRLISGCGSLKETKGCGLRRPSDGCDSLLVGASFNVYPFPGNITREVPGEGS